jgi:hypothetical protein
MLNSASTFEEYKTLYATKGEHKMTILGKAIAIAAVAHQEQTDWAGLAYILHPIRLMVKMDSEPEMIAAVLHDLIEDTEWTLERLRAEGFSEEVLAAVDCLTHRSGETYGDYIGRVQCDPIARRVKLADLEDNMDLRRTGTLSDKHIEFYKRYHHYWGLLQKTKSKPLTM